MQVNQPIAQSPAQSVDLPQKLLDYLNESRAPLAPVTDPDEPLRIDSLSLMRLVAFLENDMAITVEEDELTIDNFDTARNLARLIRAKMEERPADDPADHITLPRNTGDLVN
jgi:acyl carrier protein